MKLKRLNMDSTWWMEIDGTSFVVDPWLVGTEIDGARWLNEQWHTTEPVAIKDIPAYDFILITQAYSDHCHEETLKQMDVSKPILATAGAFKRLKKSLSGRDIILLEDDSLSKHFGLDISVFRPKKKMDPIYYAISVSKDDKPGFFYSPHGFKLTPSQEEMIQGKSYKLLITTLSDFRIPKIMGGHVNPGTENVDYLVKTLRPEHLINTHDEEKGGRGLVLKLAKVTFPDYDAAEAKADWNFIRTADYGVVDLLLK